MNRYIQLFLAFFSSMVAAYVVKLIIDFVLDYFKLQKYKFKKGKKKDLKCCGNCVRTVMPEGVLRCELNSIRVLPHAYCEDWKSDKIVKTQRKYVLR